MLEPTRSVLNEDATKPKSKFMPLSPSGTQSTHSKFCFVLFSLRHCKSVQPQAKENCSQKAWAHIPPPGLYTILHLVEEPDLPGTTNLALGNTQNSHPSSELPSLYQAGKPIYTSGKGFLICKTEFDLTK